MSHLELLFVKPADSETGCHEKVAEAHAAEEPAAKAPAAEAPASEAPILEAIDRSGPPAETTTETEGKKKKLTLFAKARRTFLLFAHLIFNRKMAAGSINIDQNQIPWPDTEAEYQLIEIIGIGATAVVYSAYCEKKNEKCAVKRINLEKCSTPMDELLTEIHAMSFCNHENVVTYYTSFVVQDELWLILRLLEGGSLLDVIKHKMKVTNCKHGVFDEGTIATVLKEVLKGLDYFHSNGQIHRDIKAGNILLGEDGVVQIADFGVAAWLSNGHDNSRQKLRHTFVGTPCWMAPEVMDQELGYDFKADIWSFGITAIEMATGTAPYHKFPPMKVLMLTLQNEPPSLDTSTDDKDTYKAYGKTFRKMIVECLYKDPNRRPTAGELLKHAFFKKAKDRKYLTQTLVAIGPSMETRVNQASKRQPNSSGRLHRCSTGEWTWSEDEAGEGGSEEERPERDSRPINQIIHSDSSEEDEIKACQEKKKAAEAASAAEAEKAKEQGDREQEQIDPKSVHHLVLRLRNGYFKNGKRELNDIKFEFTSGKDSVEGIAAELVAAGLVEPADSVEVALNLTKLMESQIHALNAPKTVTFHLDLPSQYQDENSTGPNEPYDDKALVGFAQLNIID